MQVHAIVGILALAERGRLVAACGLLTAGPVVGLLLMAAGAGAFLNLPANTTILNLLILA